MREHKLKTWPEFFAKVRDGSKTFEIRKDDRGYAVGDLLVLQEWDPSKRQTCRIGCEGCGYTGREIVALVTYKVPGGRFGLDPGFCVLAIHPTKTEPPAPTHEGSGS